MAIESCAKCGAPINRKRDPFLMDPEKGLLCALCVEPQVQHTPTPWQAEPEEASEGRGIVICSAAGDAIVATITPEDDHQADAVDWANAGLIVQAVNSHADLVAALKAIVARINGVWDDPDLVALGPLSTESADIEQIAKLAIAKA